MSASSSAARLAVLYCATCHGRMRFLLVCLGVLYSLGNLSRTGSCGKYRAFKAMMTHLVTATRVAGLTYRLLSTTTMIGFLALGAVRFIKTQIKNKRQA